MNIQHWILMVLWIIYFSIHSMLAATSVKIFFKKTLDKYFRYYRLGYSVFALLALFAILIYQYSFTSPILIKSIIVKYLAVIFLIFPGLFIMLISIKKYFILLSGVRSIFTSVSTPELKLDGIHKYVRHPLYSGTILLVFGLFFIFPTLSNLIVIILLTVYILIGIVFEESKLIKEFGNVYLEYRSQVPGLIPSFWKWKCKNPNRSIFEK